MPRTFPIALQPLSPEDFEPARAQMWSVTIDEAMELAVSRLVGNRVRMHRMAYGDHWFVLRCRACREELGVEVRRALLELGGELAAERTVQAEAIAGLLRNLYLQHVCEMPVELGRHELLETLEHEWVRIAEMIDRVRRAA